MRVKKDIRVIYILIEEYVYKCMLFCNFILFVNELRSLLSCGELDFCAFGSFNNSALWVQSLISSRQLIGRLLRCWGEFERGAPLAIGWLHARGVALGLPGCVRVRWRWKNSARHHLDGVQYL